MELELKSSIWGITIPVVNWYVRKAVDDDDDDG